MSFSARITQVFVTACIVLNGVSLAAGQEVVREGSPVSNLDLEHTTSIVFTGKLMGYFRLPNQQPYHLSTSAIHCEPPTEGRLLSPDAQVFMDTLANPVKTPPQHILVGMGDNFAPNYYSRIFKDVPQEHTNYPGKDLFSWTGERLAWYSDNDAESAAQRQGHGIIPTDNVACFLSLAHYDAIVPGKHDFYYGAERLRELARVLATIKNGDFQPVQMLAANLMIKTMWAKDHTAIPDSGKPELPFVTKYIQPSGETFRDLQIEDFTDAGFAFPWMQFVRVDATGFAPELLGKLRVYLCDAQKDPDIFVKDCRDRAPLNVDSAATEAARPNGAKLGSSAVQLVYKLEGQKSLRLGSNYAICLYESEVEQKSEKPYCLRFAVYKPFLQYPDWPDRAFPKGANDSDASSKQVYLNPDLYKVAEDNGRKVVLFGIIDPGLSEQIGGDNYAWKTVKTVDKGNTEWKYTTEIGIADPVQTLIHLEDFFESDYAEKHDHQPFEGLRVLLAQMPPEEAKQLAEHLPRCLRFDAVISAADDGLATPNEVLDVHPPINPGTDQSCPMGVGASAIQSKNAPALNDPAVNDPGLNVSMLNASLAVPPSPIFVPPTHSFSPFNKPDRSVQLRSLNITTDSRAHWQYTLSGVPVPVKVPNTAKLINVLNPFWLTVCRRIYAGDTTKACTLFPVLGANGEQEWHVVMADTGSGAVVPWEDNKVKKAAIQQLAVEAIRKRYHADVALLQERDFYMDGITDYLAEHCNKLDLNGDCAANSIDSLDVQEILDRVLWKGDYVQVQSVQGSVLKSVLKQSAEFSRVEKVAYLPVSQAGRSVIKVGVRQDLTGGGEFLINGKPLDSNELYTVVTSDYIGLGDTGYPDLAKPPVGDVPSPARSADRLVTISGATCKYIIDSTRPEPLLNKCKESLPRDGYYDELADKPSDIRKGNTEWHKLYAWSLFTPKFGQPNRKNQSSPPRSDDISTETQARVERTENWDYALDKFSLGFSGLSHSYNEKVLSQFFGGVQNGQVNGKHFHSWDWDANSKFTWFHPRMDWFISEGLQYSSNFQAQISGLRAETQSRNLFAIDGGAYVHIWPQNSKELPQFSSVLSGHFETQVGNPLTNISLSAIPPTTSQSTLTFEQGRTDLLLGRTGLRWQNRKSYVEGGLEGGQTLNAIRRFDVVPSPGATTVSCLLEASLSLTKCINSYNKINPGTPITPKSHVAVLRSPQDRYGAYWNMGVSVPLYPTVSYNFQETSDYFFLSGGDNSADTRFRHQLIHSLKFNVFPNLSFEPTYTMFFYENKLDYHSLFQQQYTIKINYSFDCSNTHECHHEAKYKKLSAQ